jgi:hypothetical protein
MEDLDWGSLAGNALGAAATLYTAKQNQKSIDRARDEQQQTAQANQLRIADLMRAPASTLPGYKDSIAAGEEGVMRGLRAQGMSQSGAAMKALTDYNRMRADENYQNYWNRGMQGVSGINSQASYGATAGADATYDQAGNRSSAIQGIGKFMTNPDTQKFIGSLWSKYGAKKEGPETGKISSNTEW